MAQTESWSTRRGRKSKVLACVDVLKTDAVEAQMLTGEADIRAAARMIGRLGPARWCSPIATGCWSTPTGSIFEAGFFPRQLIGRSGRGDTCISAYVAKRLAAPPAVATPWAAAVTSLKMEAEGPFRREMAEVEALLRSKYTPPAVDPG